MSDFDSSRTTVDDSRFDANRLMSLYTEQQSHLEKLKFHYDFVYKYCDLTKVQFTSMGNNSMAYAFAGDGTLESCVRPECQADFDKDKHLFLEVDEASRAQPAMDKTGRPKVKWILRNDPIRTDPEGS